MSKSKFRLFADYFQIYVMDENSQDDASDIWDESAFNLKLGIMNNTIAVGTYRNVEVDFELEILEEKPKVDLDNWDHVVQGYVRFPSKKCIVMGCTDYQPEAAKVALNHSDYAFYSLARGLDTIKTEWEDADDLYKLILWPSQEKKIELIKEYKST